MVMDVGDEEKKMSKRRSRTRLIREVREQFRQAVEQETIEATQNVTVEEMNGSDKDSPDGRILEAVGKRGASNASSTLELNPGDLINIITIRSHKRWTLAPAIVVDGPDRFGEVLLMPLGSSDPLRVPIRRCRPVE
jgi:hypothetical protein